MNGSKKWWSYLLPIPIVLIVDVVLFVVAALLDSALASGVEVQGHPVPAVTLVILLVMSVVTVAVIVIGIVMAARTIAKNKRMAQEPVDEAAVAQQQAAPAKKSVWKVFIPLAVQLFVSAILVYLCGSIEINNFYNDPEHIGFAVPVLTFMLFGLLSILALVTLIVSSVIAFRRNRKNKELQRL